jgi:hypothetical protein
LKHEKNNGRAKLVRSLGVALGAVLLLPTACGDDDETTPPAGGRGGTAGGDASAGRGGTSGSSGTAGRGGGGGLAGSAGSAGSGGTAGTGGSGGTAGTGGSGGTAGAGGTGGSGGADGGSCAAPTNAGLSRACLTFAPEAIAVQAGDPQLDGQGVLLVLVYNTATPGPTDTPIAPPIRYPPPSDAGPTQVSISSLPNTLSIDNLPSTVYIRALFVDNPAWFAPPQNSTGLTYGMFIGGYNLNAGVEPAPPLRAVPLTAGQGTTVNLPMRALRKFSTRVALRVTDAGPLAPLDDGQGYLSVAAFQQSDPRNAIVYGGFRGPCVNIVAGPVNVNGLFFDDGDFWFGGQVDDYGLRVPNPEGALVSLVPVPSDAGVVMRIPESQKVTVAPDQYSVTIPQVTLTGTIPKNGNPPPFACPLPDAGPG